MNLQHILDKARSLDAAQKNFKEFSIAQAGFKPDDNAGIIRRPPVETIDQENLASSEKNLNSELNATSKVEKCYFCGKRHPRKDCPAINSVCYKCRKIGHFARVCRFQLNFSSQPSTTQCNLTEKLHISSLKQDSGTKTNFVIQLNGQAVNALLDTGATNSDIREEIVKRLELPITKTFTCINLAVKGCSSETIGVAKLRSNCNNKNIRTFHSLY